jgi:hypothetical protein
VDFNGIELVKKPLLDFEHKILNGPSIISRYCFGISQHAKDACILANESIMYIAGWLLVEYQYGINKQHVRKLSSLMKELVCWSYDPDRKVLAVAFLVQIGSKVIPRILVYRNGAEFFAEPDNVNSDSVIKALIVRDSMLWLSTEFDGQDIVIIYDYRSKQESTYFMRGVVRVQPCPHLDSYKHLVITPRLIYELDFGKKVAEQLYAAEGLAPQDEYRHTLFLSSMGCMFVVSAGGLVTVLSLVENTVLLESYVRSSRVTVATSSSSVGFLGFERESEILLLRLVQDNEMSPCQLVQESVLFNIPLFRNFVGISESDGVLGLTYVRGKRLLEGPVTEFEGKARLGQRPADEEEYEDLPTMQSYALFHYESYSREQSLAHYVDEPFEIENQARIDKLVFYDRGNILLIADSHSSFKVLRVGQRREDRLRLWYKFSEKITAMDVNEIGTLILVAFRAELRMFMLLGGTLERMYNRSVQNCGSVAFSKCNRFYAYSTNQTIVIHQLQSF